MPAESENSTLSDIASSSASDSSSDCSAASSSAQLLVGDLSPIELIQLGVALLHEREVSSSAQVAELMVDVESVTRQAFALSVDALTLCQAGGFHYGDGHRSPKVMMRHVNKLPAGEATAREQCRAMFTKLPLIAAYARDGRLGKDQTKLLARIFANKRVRGAMPDRQQWFLDLAGKLSYKRFQQRVLEWQRLIDEDGVEPRGDRAHQNRTANLVQDPTDLAWSLTAIFGSVDGAANKEIFEVYCQALFDADWAEAKARVGDDVCLSDLARTDPQRKADALSQIFADAASNPNGMGPVKITHNVCWSASTYEEMARRFAGAVPRPFNVDDYRCETIDGDPVDPTEAFANSVLNKIRRVVVDARSVVIDFGLARAFTGAARDAVRITGRECFWPGCWTPATRCETDHLHDHAKGGRTCPGNGAPACGRHNRWKQKGYRVWRDDTGHIRVERPDGTLIS